MKGFNQNQVNVQRIALLLALGSLLALCYHFLVVRKAVVELSVTTDNHSIFKVYWKKSGALYSEKNMTAINIRPNESHYMFRIADLSTLDDLRFDTTEKDAIVTIHTIKIRQEGYPVLSFSTAEDFNKLKVLEGIENATVDEKGITVVPSNKDPQLQFDLPVMTYRPDTLKEAIQIFIIFVALFLLAAATKCLFSDYAYVTYLLFGILMLIVTMAVISQYNQHPDEFVHDYAAEYYRTHSLPPKVGDPTIRHTYSNYGVSRLHSGEIVYLLAGKFEKALQLIPFPSFIKLRFFNILLFSILLLLALNRREAILFLLPFLISPQIWYIFSYFNSDAFALLLITLASYQLGAPSSAFNRLLRRETMDWNGWLQVLGLGVLFGLMLLLKQNFYFYYLFLFIYFLWQILFKYLKLNKQAVIRLGVIAAVGATLAGGFWLTDQKVNNFDKKHLLMEARKQLATKMYNPDTPVQHLHPYMQMKERGVTLAQMIHVLRWGEKSFRSSFGVYGYTSVSAQFTYYDFVRVFGLCLLAVVVAAICLRGGFAEITLLLSVLAISGALLLTAFYHSWTVDFQAQGRYFLPLVAIFSILVHHTERLMPKALFQLLLLTMYFLATYSFVFVGLRNIPKIVC